MLGGKIVIEKWRFYRQETRGKTKSPEWNRWNSFKKGKVQNRKLNEVALTTVSKLSLEQVHEKQSLETPEVAKKTLLPARAVRQATFSSSQICKEEQKPYCGKGTEWSSFLGSMPKIYCFSCLI